ncbi:hypothetical protein [Neolewinella xylanilytica]|uniref:hypothetical protein n=1 Tax=Neolewinella xylanilytica TaxID=1514080 RepID=UPI000CEACE67|nr:hypothetical protein [Neolewinella xylanilytica]
MIAFPGCYDDDDAYVPEPTCEGPNGQGCTGESTCDNGSCACLDPSNQIAPEFCVQNQYRNTFVTYDQILGCSDTSLIAFLDDPFAIEWQDNEASRGLSTYGYNRDPNIYLPGGTGATLIRPAGTNTGADSIYITEIFGPEGIYCSRESWTCINSFKGAFVGRDTIRGVFRLIGCNDRNSGEPFPEAFLQETPMTFVRVN